MSKDILFISTNLYDSFPSRKPRFAHYLEELGYRILYVEPPYTILAIFKKDFLKQIRRGIEKKTENFYLLRTFAWFPFFKKSILINLVDNYIFLFRIHKTMKKLGFNPSLIFTYMPFLPFALKSLKAKIVYDCVDDHASFKGLINPKVVNYLERKTVNISDTVITTGNEKLQNKIRIFGKEPIVIENGVDWKIFANNIMYKKNIDIKKQIVYVGTISYWFDLDLIKSIAKKFNNYKVILVGPAQIDISSLKDFKNIIMTGKMEQKEIAAILRESAVSIIPFKITPLTEKIDPLKAYEYIASGIPVVSTAVGGVDKLPIYIAKTQDEFLEKIQQAINEDSFEKRKERVILSKNFSWETKYKQVKKIVEDILKEG